MPQVAKLNGEFPAAQPHADELAGDYRARLAEELGVTPERVGLLGGKAAVPNFAALSRYGDQVLQVVICPADQTVSGWTVQMLLNELCLGKRNAEADTSLVEDRLAAIEIHQAVELKSAIQTIMMRALEEPKHCKVCADVVVALNARWPELPAEAGVAGGEQKAPQTFKGELFNSLTRQFGTLRESEPPLGDGTEDAPQEDRRARHHDRALALMAFLGHLYVRQVFDQDALSFIVYELIGHWDQQPGDHQVECAVDFLTVAGPRLEAATGGRAIMTSSLDKMVDMANWAEQNGSDIFSQRVLEKVEQLLKLHRSNWGKPLSGFA